LACGGAAATSLMTSFRLSASPCYSALLLAFGAKLLMAGAPYRARGRTQTAFLRAEGKE
jgi:hypothetical protein